MNAPFDLNDARGVEQASKATRQLVAQRAQVIRNLMSTPFGREWVHSLLEALGPFRTPYTGDNNATNFNCGMQNAGFQLLSQVMDAAPQDYLQMMKEQKDGGTSSNTGSDSSGDTGSGDSDA